MTSCVHNPNLEMHAFTKHNRKWRKSVW